MDNVGIDNDKIMPRLCFGWPMLSVDLHEVALMGCCVCNVFEGLPSLSVVT